ncbi:MAG TPA: hypothetical protein O0W95_04175 [Methanocorpusculum sp.]|nr:hypothetical protein [Methanocorpusculum sp.]
MTVPDVPDVPDVLTVLIFQTLQTFQMVPAASAVLVERMMLKQNLVKKIKTLRELKEIEIPGRILMRDEGMKEKEKEIEKKIQILVLSLPVNPDFANPGFGKQLPVPRKSFLL